MSAAAKGLFKPENFAEQLDGFKFKEGIVRVDSSTFKVHQGRERKSNDGGNPTPGEIKLAWVLGITRLDEDQNPLTDEHDNELAEELVLSLGGKALANIHPGGAESSEDEEVEDLGIEVNTEGKTLFLVNGDYKIHPSTGAAKFADSLAKAGWKPEFNRCWAPDYAGSVFYLKGEPTEMIDKATGKKTTYDAKVVDKIIRAGYEKKAAKATPVAVTKKADKAAAKPAAEATKEEVGGVAADTKASSGTSEKNTEAEAILKPILESMSEELDGQRISKKALSTRVSAALQKMKVAPNMHVPVLTLIKDDKWINKNAVKFDMSYDAENNTITFGEYKEEES